MKIIIGKIISIKNPKTIVVEVERFYKHPIYEKRIRRTKRFQVHTEGQHVLKEVVRFIPTRPMSSSKRWKVAENEKIKDKKSKIQSKNKQSLPPRGKKGE